MLAATAAVGEDVGVVASGIFQGIGKNSEPGGVHGTDGKLRLS